MDPKQKKTIVDRAMQRQKILSNLRDRAMEGIRSLRQNRDTVIKEALGTDRDKRVGALREKIQQL